MVEVAVFRRCTNGMRQAILTLCLQSTPELSGTVAHLRLNVVRVRLDRLAPGLVVVSICGQSGRAESLAAASTILPARRTIKPLYAGSRQCPLVTALLTGRLAKQRPITSRHKLTSTGQHAWRATSRSYGVCSNACGHTARNLAATRRATTAPATILATDPHPGTRGILTRNLLIRRYLRAHPPSAHMPVDLVRCCSAMCNKWQR